MAVFVRKKMDTLALSEIKMRGKGEIGFGSVSDRRSGVGRSRGVALLVMPEVAKCHGMEGDVLKTHVDEIKVSTGDMRVYSAYGPGSGREEEERETF